MNVIKYDIEIRKLKIRWFHIWRKKNLIPIKKILEEKFSKESDYEGDYLTVIRNEWNKLEQRNINNLNDAAYVIGYTTVNNIKVFLFEIINSGVTGKNNISIQIYAFGELSIENILNDSYAQIKGMLPELRCDLLNKSILYIFPYNSTNNDIESTDLKIKANLSSSINLSYKDYLRWSLVIIISLVCLVWSITTKAPLDLKSTLHSFFVSGCFYVILDLIINVVVPFLFYERKRIVTINDLSSVLELTTREVSQITQVQNLTIPE
ncbi:MAG: hypothetical protein ACTHM7_12380 [Ginsengibacter sp.]